MKIHHKSSLVYFNNKNKKKSAKKSAGLVETESLDGVKGLNETESSIRARSFSNLSRTLGIKEITLEQVENSDKTTEI